MVMLNVDGLRVVMMSAMFYCYAGFRCAECRAFIVMQDVVMLGVGLLLLDE